MLQIYRKAFLFTIVLIIKVYSWNEINMDTHNNLHSFCYWNYNHVLLIGVHDIDTMDLQEKLFVPPFSLYLMFVCGVGQTWVLVIVSILIVIGTTIMFSTLGYTVLMLWIWKKSFYFHHFPYNKIVKWDKLEY